MNITYVEMVTPIFRNNDLLEKLSKCYCDMWRYDKNFGEFHQCPICKQYISFEQYKSGINYCSTGHPYTKTIPAWKEEDVKKEIAETMEKPGCIGFIAIDNTTADVIGFSWAFLIPRQEAEIRWGKKIMLGLSPYSDMLFYYSELGVKPSYRNRHIGNKLVYLVLEQAKRKLSPDTKAFLRTHGRSRARNVFETAGYKKFDEDPEYGEGRIMMATTIRNLHPQKLEFN